MIEVQFQIANHYDLMAQLDADVHDDELLARLETELALRLMKAVPKCMYLPCCGTGRHIPHLLAAGVQEIIGVDLSPVCVAKAERLFGNDHRVTLIVGDVCQQQFDQPFDAAMLLGNSFGDLIDAKQTCLVTEAMTKPVRSGGWWLMDYIGPNYLDRCQRGQTSEWQSVLNGRPVRDCRTPRFDADSGIMTIDVEVFDGVTGSRTRNSYYQKLILGPKEVCQLFTGCDVVLQNCGRASQLNQAYYASHNGELGMIARSDWWIGQKK